MSEQGKSRKNKERPPEDLSSRAMEMAGHYRVPAQRSREEAWAVLQEKIRDRKQETHPVKSRRLPRRVFSVAAALLFLVAAGTWLLFSTVTVTTPRGKQTSITLPDGSRVTLNADSRLTRKRFFFGRKVRFSGEGFFRITKGAGFRVITPEGTVTVLGTAFNVISREKTLDVACYQGRVEVAPAKEKHPVILKKGEGIKIAGDKVNNYNLKEEKESPSWEQGLFRFRDTPLQEVLNELERQFDIRIEYEGTDERHYTGSFRNDSLEKALQMVCIPMDLEYIIRDEHTVILKPAE
jgi:ferric-dicitrate binding protein FerR (iron transport regulator)